MIAMCGGGNRRTSCNNKGCKRGDKIAAIIYIGSTKSGKDIKMV